MPMQDQFLLELVDKHAYRPDLTQPHTWRGIPVCVVPNDDIDTIATALKEVYQHAPITELDVDEFPSGVKLINYAVKYMRTWENEIILVRHIQVLVVEKAE